MQITIENYLGQQLQLDDNFKVISVDGLTPADATINTSGAGIADGTFYNSSYVNQRNIVLTIVPEGNAEQGRLTLWKYFKPKYPCTLYFKTNTRYVYINGYVETIQGSPYENKARYQISVICPQPFFIDMTPAVYTQSVTSDAFIFPVTIPEEGVIFGNVTSGISVNVENVGEEQSGVVIELIASGNVVNPTIYNTTTREYFTISVEMVEGDSIIIDTRRGKKTITMYHNGQAINILNKMLHGSTWFTLQQGDNEFTYTCAYGDFNLSVQYTLYTLYEGV